jgi:DNA-binding MarR family transcriptional regulator
VQVKQVSIEALTGVLSDFITQLKKIGEGHAMELAAGMDMSFSQLCMLFILDESDTDPALHELAERLKLSVAATGRAVDVLAKQGLVARREDEHDRRVKRVVIEPKGAQLLLKFAAAHEDALRAFASRLTDQERENLFNALAPILARPATSKAKETG